MQADINRHIRYPYMQIAKKVSAYEDNGFRVCERGY